MPDTVIDTYNDHMERLKGSIPGWDSARENALDRLRTVGIPTTRGEDWRYSDIKALRNDAFGLMTMPKRNPDLAEALTDVSARLVFINGRIHEELSDLGDLWQAASVRPIGNHLMANADRVSELKLGSDGVNLLNTALMRDGFVISIPAGVEIDDPIEIIHLTSEADNASAHTRHLIEMGEGASATILERYVGDETSYWNNSILQARITEGATLNHVRLQEEGANATHTATAFVNVGAGGNYHATNISLGGSLSRFEARVRLLVDEANATVDGVALAGTGESHDMLVHIDHRMPNTTSDQIFRTVADARGKSSFQGKVTVATDAQHVNADQSFKALLLDRTAEANAKPELEIFADDVKCSHGATVGELDEKALFYLTSRGIDPITARQMLVEAFTDDAFGRTGNDALAAAIRARVADWMINHTGSDND